MRAELGLEDKFIAMYAGIHGIAQGLETVLQARAISRHREDIAFVFVGEGPTQEQLDNANTRGAGPPQRNASSPKCPPSRAGLPLGRRCSIVPLRDEPLFRGALPSKMFEAWACERPVVLSVAGEAQTAMEQARGGIAVTPEDPKAMAAAITRLADNPGEATEMGKRGRLFVEQHYSRRDQARKLESLLLQICG